MPSFCFALVQFSFTQQIFLRICWTSDNTSCLDTKFNKTEALSSRCCDAFNMSHKPWMCLHMYMKLQGRPGIGWVVFLRCLLNFAETFFTHQWPEKKISREFYAFAWVLHPWRWKCQVLPWGTFSESCEMSTSMVLTSVTTPIGVTYQISCLSDVYIVNHNTSKITATGQHEDR